MSVLSVRVYSYDLKILDRVSFGFAYDQILAALKIPDQEFVHSVGCYRKT